MRKIIEYIILGIIAILIISKCDTSENNYKYKQNKLSLEIDTLTETNDKYFDSITDLQLNKTKPLEHNLKVKKQRLNANRDTLELKEDIRDTIIDMQDTLIEHKDTEIKYKDIIISNLQVKEIKYEQKLELKDLEIKDIKKKNIWKTIKNILITAISTAIIIGVIYLISV